MADAISSKPIDTTLGTEKYDGPGRITSALGIGAVAAIPAAMIKYLSGIRMGVIDGELQAIATKGRGLAAVGAVVGASMVVYGWVRGWKNANKGKEQFETMKAERDNLQIHKAVLETQVAMSQPDMHRQFSAGMAPRAVGNFADSLRTDQAVVASAEAAR